MYHSSYWAFRPFNCVCCTVKRVKVYRLVNDTYSDIPKSSCSEP